ncbi:MAG: hypothetical protein ACJAYU_005000 [Bradymonadia bacterium]|jgi:hypothetical protein
MQTVPYERRKLRSNQANRALGFLFESVADTHDVTHVALADNRGLLLVHWGEARSCDVLAAYGPLLFKTIDPISRSHILDTLASTIQGADSDRISIRRFKAHGEELYLCVLGEPGAAKDVALNRVIGGARRILS